MPTHYQVPTWQTHSRMKVCEEGGRPRRGRSGPGVAPHGNYTCDTTGHGKLETGHRHPPQKCASRARRRRRAPSGRADSRAGVGGVQGGRGEVPVATHRGGDAQRQRGVGPGGPAGARAPPVAAAFSGPVGDRDEGEDDLPLRRGLH
eukprot:scaffold3600_cov387-Prasinococcus_capsulatus_cf.AAC.13